VLVQTDDGCMAGWAYENEGTLVDGTACELGGLAMNPDVGDLYVSTVEGIVLVPPGDATTVVDAEADLAVYDTFTGFLYTAAKGETWVRAIDGAGAVAWTTDLGSPVVALDDLGWQEGAVALVNFGGTDQVWILDAWTGEATLGDETPAGSTDISVSRNGRDYALVGADQVAFREFARHIRE
jgi:hypothetical protein